MFQPTGYSDFISFQRDNLNKSPQDIRAYWTPERKRAAVPAHRFRSGANIPDSFDAILPDAANAIPTTDPKQADLGIMPFVTGGKLFFTLDGVDFTATGNIFMRNNLLLTAAHCIQDDVSGNLAENFLFERGFTGEESAEDFAFKTVALKENWYIEKDNKWDYAIAILNQDSTIPTPLKYTTENILGRTVTAYGYPLDFFEGAQMVFINGTITERADKWTIINGKLGPGASGGAWVLEDNQTAIGLTSFGVNTAKGGIYMGSPKFDEEFDNLYQYVLSLM